MRAQHRRHGLETDDAEPHACRHAVGEIARREPTPAAGSVDFIPPEDGVHHLHAAENAQKQRVAAGPTVAATQESGQRPGDERAGRDAHLEAPAGSRPRPASSSSPHARAVPPAVPAAAGASALLRIVAVAREEAAGAAITSGGTQRDVAVAAAAAVVVFILVFLAFFVPAPAAAAQAVPGLKGKDVSAASPRAGGGEAAGGGGGGCGEQAAADRLHRLGRGLERHGRHVFWLVGGRSELRPVLWRPARVVACLVPSPSFAYLSLLQITHVSNGLLCTCRTTKRLLFQCTII